MISASLPLPVLAGAPPSEPRRGEVINKTPTQHAAEAGFALASSAAVLGPVGRTGQMVPGLNLGVGLLETHNALNSLRKKDHTAMMGHAGNALGCMASFAEDAGRLMSAYHQGHKLSTDLTGLVIGLGLVGGTCGVIQGIREIHAGRLLKANHGTTRTLHMGIADTISGSATLLGIGLRMTGHAPTLGAALLIGASICDLTSIAVDYFDRRGHQPHPPTTA